MLVDDDTFDGATAPEAHDVVLARLHAYSVGQRKLGMVSEHGATIRFERQPETTFRIGARREVRASIIAAHERFRDGLPIRIHDRARDAFVNGCFIV